MKKALKLAVIPISFLICSQMIGCNMNSKEVALITDVGDIDDGSFNQASWEAIKEYCGNNKKTYDYYRPFADSDFARKAAVKQAVYKGAKVIILPGFKFASCASQCQTIYPNVHFLLIDSGTTDLTRVGKNTCCVGYNCEISGFLAGYSIMMDYMLYDVQNDNHTLRDKYEFGYCGGMASNGVLQFGFGYIQGIINAVSFFKNNVKKEVNWPEIIVDFNYAHVFGQSDAAASLMKSWYADGCKCVFACGGKLYQSITEGVKDYNSKNGYSDLSKIDAPRNAARWVGVDSDQYLGLTDINDKKTIYTSALKGLNPTIQTALDYHFNNKWDLIGGAYDSTTVDVLDKSGKKIGVDDKTKQWPLTLHTKFGERPGETSTIEEKDYVGIPTATKDDKKTLRGFNYVTLEEYTELLKNLKASDVYPGNGTDIYESKEATTPIGDSNMGIPTFFGDSKNKYIVDPNDSTKKISFYDAYLRNDTTGSAETNIPAEKIKIKYI